MNNRVYGPRSPMGQGYSPSYRPGPGPMDYGARMPNASKGPGMPDYLDQADLFRNSKKGKLTVDDLEWIRKLMQLHQMQMWQRSMRKQI